MAFIFGFILTCVISYIFYSSHRKKEKKECISEEEILAWQPKPLVEPQLNVKGGKYEKPSPIVPDGKVSKIVTINGKELVNFATHNYLNMIENEFVSDRAKNSIFKYGVGSCGPRGFYGTVDVHLELESRLASFMKVESAIVYSYGFTTIASAIAAYAKKNDVIYADEKVNFAIQRGMEVSRSKIYYFKHNDVEDLCKLLESHEKCDNQLTKSRSKVRKFLIVEGIYANSGHVCPLSALVDLKKRYKLRLFIDESISFGVLGENGRGVVEHCNVDMDDVDMIMASMEYALGTSGGFCVGSTFIVEHQRLSGSGYCFSASLPPFLATAAIAALDIIEQRRDDLVAKLSDRCRRLHSTLLTSAILPKFFVLECDECSPIKHLILKNAEGDNYERQLYLLEKIASSCRDDGILVTPAHYLIEKEHTVPLASLRLTVSALMEDFQIDALVRSLERASSTVVSSGQS